MGVASVWEEREGSININLGDLGGRGRVKTGPQR